MDRIEFWLRLFMLKGIRYQKLYHFVQRYSQQENPDKDLLVELMLNTQQYHAFMTPDQQRLTRTQRWLERANQQILLLGEAEYPTSLLHIHHPPLFLFIRGKQEHLSAPQLAIVGSRRCSEYAKQCAWDFSVQLSYHGIAITSGLALGVDAAAHGGALQANGITVAVFGCGLDVVYPRQHGELATKIIENRGVLVSEFFPGTPPIAANFPRRNRIISGLSQAVLIIEASLHSGSLITARHALEQGKEVLVIPGRINDAYNIGGHRLIQQGATVVIELAEILQQLQLPLQWLTLPEQTSNQLMGTNHIAEQSLSLPLTDILNSIMDDITPIDIIVRKTGYSVADIMTKLLELELAGLIVSVSGGYQRVTITRQKTKS